MKIALSPFASSQTGVEIHTAGGRRYGTDVFENTIFDTLVGQKPGDSIDSLIIHRGTSRGQVESGNLEEKVKTQILALLPR